MSTHGAASLADVAVVVVNYNSHALVETNLVSSLGPDFPGDVVIVDSWSNASEREAMGAVCDRQGWRLVAPPGNPGFGGGCNLGVRAVREGTCTLVMMNPDARISLADLARLVARVKESPDGLIAPTVMRPNGKVYSSKVDLLLATGEMRATRTRAVDVADTDVHMWASGALFALSLDLWNRVGGFDEDYFLYWEDVDLCRRITLKGGNVIVDESLRAVHDEGATQGRSADDRTKSPIYYYYNCRNRILYARHHLTRGQRRRWIARSPISCYRILLQGGKRQLIRPSATWLPAARGLLDGLRGRTGQTF